MPARKAKFSESQMVLEWLTANREKNDFDPGVMDYPTTVVMVAPEENPSTVMPIHLAVMLESLGFAPDANVNERLTGALDCVRAAVEKAKALQVKEIVFLSSDERIDRFTEKLGFRPIKAMRLKL